MYKCIILAGYGQHLFNYLKKEGTYYVDSTGISFSRKATENFKQRKAQTDIFPPSLVFHYESLQQSVCVCTCQYVYIFTHKNIISV